MARIAYLSPLPPASTGIARYSDAVLARLRARPGIEVEALWPRSMDEGERLVGRSDLAVYHVGNNLRFHRHIYALAVRHPGLVVLHDLGLDDLAAGLDAASDPLGPATRTEERAAAARLAASGLEVDEPLQTPWCALLARRARGVIVHAPFGRRYLEGIGCRTPVYVVPHPPIPEPGGWRAAGADRRVRRRLGGRGPLIGVLGDVGRSKGIEALLAALGRVQEDAVLAIVGRRIPGFEARTAVRTAGQEGRVIVDHDVSDAAFGAWLRACDVVVNLRHPHRGEVSGTLVRALQAGVPTVVSATGTYLDVPEDAVVRVPPGPPSPEALADALGSLLADPERRRRIGERARAYVDELDRDATGGGYAGAIESTLHLLRDPVRTAVARWAGALGDLGATEDDLHLGARYVERIAELAEADPDGPATRVTP